MSKALGDHVLMSKAVGAWYRHYGAEWDDHASSFLCDAAIDIYDNGCRSAEMMAATLISKYVGSAGTGVNAPSSDSVH
jgi:hypothetical protein